MPLTGPMRFLDPEVLRAIASIELRARVLVEGLYASQHRSPYYGYSVEFKDYREYAPGDEPRIIDWRMLARTERYYVRRFEMESNMDVVCLLDTSGSMAYEPLDPKRLGKLEYAKYLVAGLAYLVSRQQDSPGLAAFDQDLATFVPPRQGRRHLFALLATLDQLAASGPTDFPQVLQTVALRLRRRCLVVVLSDFHADEGPIGDGLRKLAARGHELVIFQLLDEDELNFPFDNLVSFRDLESRHQYMCDPLRQRRQYRERLDAFLNQIREAALSCGADYRLLSTATPLEAALRDYLLYRRRR